MLLFRSAPYCAAMRRVVQCTMSVVLLAGAVACYRLPLHIRENDATGYEEVGIPTIEAVEYTPNGRDLRVLMEAPGYVTVIVVDPDRGATVRFRRGELQSRFAVLPEAKLKLGCRLGDNCHLFAGYDFMYLSDAVRPGDQVDLTIDPSRAPILATGGIGPLRPRQSFARSDFWVQGLLLGFDCRY